jgi:hypothetical protein
MTWQLDPVSPDPQVASTGESYIMQAAVRCGGAGCSVESVDAIPIANFKNEKGEMVVARLSSLADGTITLSASWRAYYAGRLKRMEKYLAQFAAGDR